MYRGQLRCNALGVPYVIIVEQTPDALLDELVVGGVEEQVVERRHIALSMYVRTLLILASNGCDATTRGL
jgi:hypothetical protein